MDKLDKTILYILSRAQEKGKDNLSKFELFKYLYLLEVESYKFTGRSFFDSSVSFARDKNGPISLDIYHAVDRLSGYIDCKETKKADYGYPRHCLFLKKKVNKINLADSEKLFINSVISSYIQVSIAKLKEIVYSTEPMENIINKERQTKKILKGQRLDFNCILLDEDIVDLVAA